MRFFDQRTLSQFIFDSVNQTEFKCIPSFFLHFRTSNNIIKFLAIIIKFDLDFLGFDENKACSNILYWSIDFSENRLYFPIHRRCSSISWWPKIIFMVIVLAFHYEGRGICYSFEVTSRSR